MTPHKTMRQKSRNTSGSGIKGQLPEVPAEKEERQIYRKVQKDDATDRREEGRKEEKAAPQTGRDR